MNNEEVKQEIYLRYEAKFGLLFKRFLKEKEAKVCQFCDDADCPRVARNFQRAVEMMLQGISVLASKRAKDKSDRLAQMVYCALAPITAVGTELDVLIEDDNETYRFLARQIIKHIEGTLELRKGKFTEPTIKSIVH